MTDQPQNEQPQQEQQKQNISIQKASPELSQIDVVAKSICEVYDGEVANRLLDGLFTLPYREITNNLDPTLTYYFDDMLTVESGMVPKIYAWRWWGYRAVEIIENIKNNGYKVEKL